MSLISVVRVQFCLQNKRKKEILRKKEHIAYLNHSQTNSLLTSHASYVQDHPLVNQIPLQLLFSLKFSFHSLELLHGEMVHFIMRQVFQVHFLRSGSNTVHGKFPTECSQFRIGKGSFKTLLPRNQGSNQCTVLKGCVLLPIYIQICSISIIKPLRVFYLQDVKYQLIWFNICLIWFTKQK